MNRIFTILSLSLLMMIGMADGQTHLWGTTYTGGSNIDWGTIFTADANGDNLHSVYSMSYDSGAHPIGSMVLANNEKFYGIASSSFCGIVGVCYAYDPFSNNFSIIHNFCPGGSNAYNVKGGLTLSSDGNIYGLCYEGGTNNGGVIYKIDPSTNIYTDIYSFIDSSGYSPFGTLVQLSDGKFYGMTNLGGLNNDGVIFCFDPINNIYTNLYSFNGIAGRNPWFGKLLKATDGKLYGMTQLGGVNNFGVIFSYDLSTNEYVDIHDFDSTHGEYPVASLIQATNGLFYGLTNQGGVYQGGVIFSFDISTNTYVDRYNFDDGINGALPDGELIEIPDSLLNGINSIPNKEEITIYPNPANSTITIHSQLSILNSQLIITDVLGNEVYHQAINNSNNQTINISNLSTGVYFYQLTNNKETIRGKFIKE